jgi:hypothetical protein
MRGRSSDRSARSRSVHRSTGRPVGSPSVAVAAQSLVENVRLAALCGLLRCEIAEDPKGNRRRRSMRRMPRELASGSSEKWRRPVSTGERSPGSGPAADIDDRSMDPQSQCILRTIWRTKTWALAGRGALRQEVTAMSATGQFQWGGWQLAIDTKCWSRDRTQEAGQPVKTWWLAEDSSGWSRYATGVKGGRTSWRSGSTRIASAASPTSTCQGREDIVAFGKGGRKDLVCRATRCWRQPIRA